jgi:hypothetical protein
VLDYHRRGKRVLEALENLDRGTMQAQVEREIAQEPKAELPLPLVSRLEANTGRKRPTACD